MPDPTPDPRKDQSEAPDQGPVRTGPDRERPPGRRERGPGQGYGNAPGVEDVEAWHREVPLSRKR